MNCRILKRTGKNLLRFILLRLYYPMIYRRYARRPIQKEKVLFIENTASGLSENFRLLRDRLEESGTYQIQLCLLEKTKVSPAEYHRRCCGLVKTSADAGYILLNDALGVFGHVSFREETRIYNVWHACGAFKKFGFGTADLKFGENRRIQEKYPNYTYCTGMFVSAPEVVDHYAFSTGLPKEKVLPLGISRTDVFYDPAFRDAARKKLESVFPGAEGKKVILYAPTFRGTVRNASAPEALSVPAFYKALSDRYVLVIKHHPFVGKRPAVETEYRNFAADLTEKMEISELLCTADLCITDYSSVIFEYALLERPMLFFAFDREEYDGWRGFYYDYDEMTPGPVFSRNEEMIEYILQADMLFEPQQIRKFTDRFMCACDGHATERIFNYIFEKETDERGFNRI